MTFNTEAWQRLDCTPDYVINVMRTVAAIAFLLSMFFGILALVTSNEEYGLVTVVLAAVWIFVGLAIRRARRLELQPF